MHEYSVDTDVASLEVLCNRSSLCALVMDCNSSCTVSPETSHADEAVLVAVTDERAESVKVPGSLEELSCPANGTSGCT